MKITIYCATPALLTTLASSAPTPNALRKRDISVLTPQWGYSVTWPGNHTQITWTEPTTRDVKVTLVRGAPGQLVEVGPYDSCESTLPFFHCKSQLEADTCVTDVDNDGQYQWLNEDYEDTDLKSGCDYKFRLSIQADEDDFAESEYFTIVVNGDGGLTPDTMCPGPRGSEGETVSYGDLAAVVPDGSAEGPVTEDGPTGGDGVSTTTLVTAVVVSDIGIILLLVAVVLFGRKRSWFASRDYLARYVGIVHEAQARLKGQSQAQQGQMYATRNEEASTQEQYLAPGSHPDGISYTLRDEKNPKIAQLE